MSSLCGPNIQFQSKGSPAANIPDVAQSACGGWALLSRWIAAIIDESDPFTITDAKLQESALLSAANFDPKISRAISEEAALEGITLFHQAPGAVSFDRAVTVIDSQNAGAAYASLAFNILVNRVARLAVMRLSVSTASKTKRRRGKGFVRVFAKGIDALSCPGFSGTRDRRRWKRRRNRAYHQFRRERFRVPGAVFFFAQFVMRQRFFGV